MKRNKRVILIAVCVLCVAGGIFAVSEKHSEGEDTADSSDIVPEADLPEETEEVPESEGIAGTIEIPEDDALGNNAPGADTAKASEKESAGKDSGNTIDSDEKTEKSADGSVNRNQTEDPHNLDSQGNPPASSDDIELPLVPID